jgi:hypothetical protein
MTLDPSQPRVPSDADRRYRIAAAACETLADRVATLESQCHAYRLVAIEAAARLRSLACALQKEQARHVRALEWARSLRDELRRYTASIVDKPRAA